MCSCFGFLNGFLDFVSVMHEFALGSFRAISCLEVSARRGMPILALLVRASAFKPSKAGRPVGVARRGLASLLG